MEFDKTIFPSAASSVGPLGGAVLLAADRYTPLKRTPWAGARIAQSIKNLVFPDRVGELIGESWEFSCDPELPSLLWGTTQSLADFVRQHAEAVLSKELIARSGPVCEVLVKIVNAASPLSLQIHPRDGDVALKPGECGKPESWYVLHAEAGAGLYLGFARSVRREDLKAMLVDSQRTEELRNLLYFVPVKAGDYFEIEPGVPHAIGPGVTLLEPQRILFNQSGKTYRMWDWGRRYDASGVEVATGASGYLAAKPRELHVEAGVRLTDPERQVGEAFVATTRRTPKVHKTNDFLCEEFPANPYYQTRIVSSQNASRAKLIGRGGYGVVIMLAGEASFIGVNGAPIKIRQGMSALLPNSAWPFLVDQSLGAQWALITPAGVSLELTAG